MDQDSVLSARGLPSPSPDAIGGLSWYARLFRRHSVLPYSAALLVVALSGALAMTLQRREERDLQVAAQVKAQSLAALAASHLHARLTVLARLASASANGLPTQTTWDAAAFRVIQSGAFRSVAWIDSLGRVVAAVPDESESENAPELRLAAERAAVARAARVTSQLSTGAPVFTSTNVPVVISAAPAARGSAAIVGEIALPTVLHQALDADAGGYSFAVYADGRELYVHSVGPRALEATWGREVALSEAGPGWVLRVWPTESELAWRNSRLPETVLLVGVLFALGLAGTMRMYQTADRRAHALAMANDRLEGEIHERERAQQALLRSEEQLRQSQKMEAVGQLAGGIAHDFNNLLTAINGYADFLLTDIERTDPRREDVREIKKAATRAGALTTQLLAFSRQQIRQPRSLDLNALLTDLERMLRRVIGEDVTIDWAPGEDIGNIQADPSEIEQVLMNFVVNASDAMPHGGTIGIATSTVRLRDAERAPLPAGRYTVLCVCDTGTGMDAATKSRIFEPFFTTKERGKGTGLGLSTAYAIVQTLHGAIEVKSRLHVGTTFTVYLPQHDAPADAVAPVTTTPSAPRGAETVLLVEDEEGVRALGARILERHGYTVLEARNGRDALTIVGLHPGSIDLLLTDVVMPEMGGKQLAEVLSARDESLSVLFISGYTDGDISRRGELNPNTAFLQKPFTATGLLQRVRDVLDARPVTQQSTVSRLVHLSH